VVPRYAPMYVMAAAAATDISIFSAVADSFVIVAENFNRHCSSEVASIAAFNGQPARAEGSLL